jgi:hypothetical protein
MAISQSIRKKARSGRAMRFEPQDLELINEDPTIKEYFEQTGCMHLCERIQGYNAKMVEQFALNFIRVSTTIARITFQVTEETLSSATEIHLRGEKWFKGMTLEITCYMDFIKSECRNQKIGADIPS